MITSQIIKSLQNRDFEVRKYMSRWGLSLAGYPLGNWFDTEVAAWREAIERSGVRKQ
jgi:hypothetical protein